MSRSGRFTAVCATLVLVAVLGMPGTASADGGDRQMRNNPTYYNDAICHNDVWMNYYITDRSDITSAEYRDQYRLNDGTWANASASYVLHDSNTADKRMITNLSDRRVRVRANHYVTTTQGGTAGYTGHCRD